jgi:aryl-alcohol dehydrogenase-like predicted oxidoreductase
LERARQQGKIRHLGAEVQTVAQLAASVASGLDFVVCDQSIIRHVVRPAHVPWQIAVGTIECFAIRPLAGGWLTNSYQRIGDFAEGDRRREWYAVGEAARARVAGLCEAAGIPIYEAALRFLLMRPYPQRIVIGTRTPEQLLAALDPRLLTPLPDLLDQAFQTYIEQPFLLEP